MHSVFPSTRGFATDGRKKKPAKNEEGYNKASSSEFRRKRRYAEYMLH